jgi:nitronate monooxygenase
VILESLEVPIVLAPMAGGPSTPELAAAVARAGGLGFLAAGYLSADALAEKIERARELTDRPLAVNLFHPGEGPSDRSAFADYVEHLQAWAAGVGLELGEPRYSDDDWEAKLDLLVGAPVRVISFTFGCPAQEVVQRLHHAGSEVWVTVTSPQEGVEAQAAGADVLVAQGSEAGGHRGSFRDRRELPVHGLLALLSVLRAELSLPLVASGGIATGETLAAALAAGAHAVQIGSAFMLCPEAGTAAPVRAALRAGGQTMLTRAFTGRLARGIRNRFIAEHEAHAALAYPEIHYVTAPMRATARAEGDPELINLWAGEAHALALELPAADIVAKLAADARTALAHAGSALGL